MPETQIESVASSSGQVKVTNRYVYNQNNNSSKLHKPSQTGIMPKVGGHPEFRLPVITEFMRIHIIGWIGLLKKYDKIGQLVLTS